MSQVHWRLLVAALWVMVLASALGVVYGKQEARNRFSELQKLTTARDDLDIEWGQLQLEQSTWATQGRVERVALGLPLPLGGGLVEPLVVGQRVGIGPHDVGVDERGPLAGPAVGEGPAHGVVGRPEVAAVRLDDE